MNWIQKKNLCKLIVTVLTVIAIITIALASCGAGQSKEPETVTISEESKLKYSGIEEYEVGPFETISHIAVKYIPSDGYMQQWIKDVQKLNGRKNSTIYVGEVIKVYMYEREVPNE